MVHNALTTDDVKGCGPLGADLRISFMGPDGDPSYDAQQASVAYNRAADE